MMMGGKDPAHLRPRGVASPLVQELLRLLSIRVLENQDCLTGNLDTCPELVALTTRSVCSLMSDSPGCATFSPTEFIEIVPVLKGL